MKRFRKWRVFSGLLGMAGLLSGLIFALQGHYGAAVLLVLLSLAGFLFFLLFWRELARKGIQTDVEISRVLGRDAKDALVFGEVGIITYNDEYVTTWISDYLRDLKLNLVNQKLTAFLPNIRDLFENEVDTITGSCQGKTFEVTHKEGSQVLFVKNITGLARLQKQIVKGSIVVGVMNLDNYDEYQSSDNEEIINEINTRLRTPLISWAKENGIFLRRLRNDRYIMLLDTAILSRIRRQNFAILQKIKDISARMDISVTLSMVLVENMANFTDLDRALNDILEIVQSRGGDQIAIKNGSEPIEFIGGNSEKASQRSKVRVRIVGSSIQDLVRNSGKVFILGHVNTDFDAMGAALAMSNWVRALHKEPYIVLKDVPRDAQLEGAMEHYAKTIRDRDRLITEDEALELMDPDKDLLVMVDHSNPAISSGKRLLEKQPRTIIIDHHRRSEQFPDNVLTSYIESQASSTCEMMTELLEASPVSIPIYEMEATIMYLGILVDTGRFKQHTSERTFQAAGLLRSWGANAESAEKALQESYEEFRRRSMLIEGAECYHGKYMIDVLPEPVSRTQMSQVSDSLLKFKGCAAAFTIGINRDNGNTAISARSDGTVNVQKIMEKMNGGGHFSAAALEREDLTPEKAAEILKGLLDEEDRNDESHSAH